MKLFFRRLLVCGIALSASLCSARPYSRKPQTMRVDGVFSATRQINALQLSPRGELWAATAGGVLRAMARGGWRKWTRADGLPSHEIAALSWRDGDVIARTPRGNAVLKGRRWHESATDADAEVAPVSAIWRGARYLATPNGLEARNIEMLGAASAPENATPRHFALPASRGTHITALLARADALLVALYGDGVWRFDGAIWSKFPGVPEAARDVTSLAGKAAGPLWLGTRRDGIWKWNGLVWRALPASPEPFDHNAQSILRYGGALWISTLEDGLVARTAKSWRHFDVPQISTSAPRQLVSFGGALYVRHGGGQVDRFDGKRWARDVFSFVPRHKTLCIAQGGGKLYLGQWGGWSQWNGAVWSHHFSVPELRGVPLMTIQPDGGVVWVGTQSKGLVECIAEETMGNSSTEVPPAKIFDERNGLPDEWITTTMRLRGWQYAGTFVGGLAWQTRGDDKWHSVAALRGENVTALEPDGTGGLWIGTRNGLWRWRDGKVARVNVAGLDSEIQALCADGSRLWVGTRTGLFRLARR